MLNKFETKSENDEKEVQGRSRGEERDSLLPPAVIGILGGGQLGRMLALSAREMGYRIVTLDPIPDSPCGQVADRQIVAAFDDVDGARQLGQEADLITYEFENISSDVARVLAQDGHLPQGAELLYITQNRLREKAAIEKAGVPVAPYVPVASPPDLEQGLKELGLPAVLKTAEGGYDGKGQLVIRSREDAVRGRRMIEKGERNWVLEELIPFERELSVIVARNPQGEVAVFPVVENIHRNNILHLTIAPARVDEGIKERATALAVKLAQAFQLVGLLAIEMFLLPDGHLLVNELAPRPHNSGHYTQQGCSTSQFEQHIRAVCNLPLGETQLRQPTVMVNILGQHLKSVLRALPRLDPAFKLHLYGKAEAKPERKMGHLNVLAGTVEEALDKIKALRIWNMEGVR